MRQGEVVGTCGGERAGRHEDLHRRDVAQYFELPVVRTRVLGMALGAVARLHGMVGEEEVPELMRDREPDARRPAVRVELDAWLLTRGRDQTRIVEVLARHGLDADALGELEGGPFHPWSKNALTSVRSISSRHEATRSGWAAPQSQRIERDEQ